MARMLLRLKVHAQSLVCMQPVHALRKLLGGIIGSQADSSLV